jgi:hypothetical protein
LGFLFFVGLPCNVSESAFGVEAFDIDSLGDFFFSSDEKDVEGFVTVVLMALEEEVEVIVMADFLVIFSSFEKSDFPAPAVDFVENVEDGVQVSVGRVCRVTIGITITIVIVIALNLQQKGDNNKIIEMIRMSK